MEDLDIDLSLAVSLIVVMNERLEFRLGFGGLCLGEDGFADIVEVWYGLEISVIFTTFYIIVELFSVTIIPRKC